MVCMCIVLAFGYWNVVFFIEKMRPDDLKASLNIFIFVQCCASRFGWKDAELKSM